MTSLRGILATLVLGVAAAIVIVAVSIIPFLNPVFVGFEQDRAQAQAWTGWTTAELRTVTLVFNVTVPAPVEDAVGRSVYIAGFLDRLDGDLPQWDAGGVVLTRVDDTHWTITLHGKESTQIEYKYALGSFDFVEKDGACGEIANRLLTLSYGATGTQTVNDTVPNWRNVDPCGN